MAMTVLRDVAVSLLTFVLLASIWGCGPTRTREGTGEYVDDSVITTKVKTAILNDSTLKVNEINVETFKGVVQLSGFVRSQADIDKAVQVARGVSGVKSVKNDMRIKWRQSVLKLLTSHTRRTAMRTSEALVVGAIVGAVAGWLWGREIESYVGERHAGFGCTAHPDVEEGAGQVLDRGGDALRRAVEFLQDTKEHVTEALRTGEDAIRPVAAPRVTPCLALSWQLWWHVDYASEGDMKTAPEVFFFACSECRGRG
jgi:hypothetical protein